MDGIEFCEDRPAQIPEQARATLVRPGEEQTQLRMPAGAAIASRDAALSEIAVERGVEFGTDGHQTFESRETLDMRDIVHPENAQPLVTGEFHPAADDLTGVEAQAVTVEHGVGVQPVVRADTHLDHATPVNKKHQKKVAHAQITPSKPKQIPQEVPRPDVTQKASVSVSNPPAPRQPAPAPAHVQPQASAGPGFAVDKIRVVLKSEKMGTHRIRVNKLSVSDTVIILGYIDDDDAVIVEPPITADGESPIEVTCGQDKYECLYYGFTAEMTIDGFPMLLVVLVRVDE